LIFGKMREEIQNDPCEEWPLKGSKSRDMWISETPRRA
jgi:hypothetical protein